MYATSFFLLDVDELAFVAKSDNGELGICLFVC